MVNQACSQFNGFYLGGFIFLEKQLSRIYLISFNAENLRWNVITPYHIDVVKNRTIILANNRLGTQIIAKSAQIDISNSVVSKGFPLLGWIQGILFGQVGVGTEGGRAVIDAHAVFIICTDHIS